MGGRKPLTIEYFQEIARSKGGECLSTIYLAVILEKVCYGITDDRLGFIGSLEDDLDSKDPVILKFLHGLFGKVYQNLLASFFGRDYVAFGYRDPGGTPGCNAFVTECNTHPITNPRMI